MAAVKYSALDKAAIALLAMGEAGAAQVLSGMQPDEVKRIAGAMSRIGRVDQATADLALAELRDRLAQGGRHVSGGSQLAKRLIERVLGPAVAQGYDPALDLGSPALRQQLAEYEPRALAPFLAHEHPQSAAVILAHLEPKAAAATLRLLAEGTRVDLIRRVARLGAIDPETLSDLADALKSALETSRISSRPDLGGAGKVAAVLNAMGREQSDRLLVSLTDSDPELAATVRGEMFRFDDLVRLDDKGIRALLPKIPEATLLLALKATSDAVQSLVFRNVSERAAARLRDDLAALPKVRKTDVEEAQRRIVEVVLTLLEAGELALPDDENPYV